MMLQASRYVFKLVKKLKKDQHIHFPFEYLANMDTFLSIKGIGTTVDELLNLTILDQAMAVRSLYQIRETVRLIEKSKEPSKIKDNELFAQMKLNMVIAHIKYLAFYLFQTQINRLEIKDTNIKPIITDLAKIYALKSLVDDCGVVFDSGYFAASAHKNLKTALDQLIKKMRPHLIPLAESFSLPDFIFPSSIGNSYGDIYEQQLKWAMNSKLNLEDKDGVTDLFENYIKPFLHEEPQVDIRSKL